MILVVCKIKLFGFKYKNNRTLWNFPTNSILFFLHFDYFIFLVLLDCCFWLYYFYLTESYFFMQQKKIKNVDVKLVSKCRNRIIYWCRKCRKKLIHKLHIKIVLVLNILVSSKNNVHRFPKCFWFGRNKKNSLLLKVNRFTCFTSFSWSIKRRLLKLLRNKISQLRLSLDIFWVLY